MNSPAEEIDQENRIDDKLIHFLSHDCRKPFIKVTHVGNIICFEFFFNFLK